VTAPATSTDTDYNGLDTADVTVLNIDNDTRGITVTPTSGLVTTEAGGTASFTIVLSTQPTADVKIPIRSSDTSEGKATVGAVTFTAANWNTPQRVTVQGVNDSVDDGDIAYTILTLPAITTDVRYNRFNAADVSAINTDNDRSGFVVTPTTGLTTSESGGTASFTIRLLSEPTANVTIGLTSGNTAEGRVSPASVTFTPGTPASGSASNVVKWNTPFRVLVTGVNDSVEDGHVSYRIITSAAASSDPNYNNKSVPDVVLRNLDNDDQTAPLVAITNPRDGAAYTQISRVTGTALDPNNPNFRFVSGIRSIGVQLLRFDDPATPENEEGVYNPSTGRFEATSTELIPASYNATTGTWTANLPVASGTNSLAPGKYRVRAIAVDNASNRTVTPFVNFTVDATQPTVTITTPVEDASFERLAQVRGTATDNAGGSGIARVELLVFRYADATNGISSGYLAPDGSFGTTATRLRANGSETSGVYNWTYTLPPLLAARYFVRAFAIDRAGNESAPVTRNFTIRGNGGDEFTGNVTYFISVPYMDSSGVNATTTPAKAFSVPPIDPATGQRNYILQRYNPQTLVYENIGNNDIIRRGEGYLLRPVNRGTRILRPTEDSSRRPLASTIQEFQITLRNNPSMPAREGSNGYNLIGDPFDPASFSAADWQNARVTATIDGQTFTGTVAEAAAADRQILDARLFTFNSTTGAFEPVSGPLLPFKGYFVRTFVDGVQVNLKAIP
jgi:hypothetical protein